MPNDTEIVNSATVAPPTVVTDTPTEVKAPQVNPLAAKLAELKANPGRMTELLNAATAQALDPKPASAPQVSSPEDKSKVEADLDRLLGAEDEQRLEPQEPVGDEEPAFYVDATGRKRDRRTGQFLSEAATASQDGTEAPASGVQDPSEGTPDAQAASEANNAKAGEEGETPQAFEVTLPITRREGEEPVTIEVEDQETADLLRANLNGAMRRQRFEQAMELVEGREAQLREFEALMQTAPEVVVLDRVRPEVRRDVARQLLAEFLSDPQFREDVAAWYNDDNARRTAVLDFKEQRGSKKEQVTQTITTLRQSESVRKAVAKMVPESVDPKTAQMFMRDAMRDLGDLADLGHTITPDTVSAQLRHRVQQYNFQLDSSTKSATTPVTPITAAPSAASKKGQSQQSDPAAAQRRAPADPKHAEARTRRVRAQRELGRSVAPPGAGAIPTRQPAVPKGVGIEGIVQHLRQNPGLLRKPSA